MGQIWDSAHEKAPVIHNQAQQRGCFKCLIRLRSVVACCCRSLKVSRLKIRRRKAWGFDSPSRHHIELLMFSVIQACCGQLQRPFMGQIWDSAGKLSHVSADPHRFPCPSCQIMLSRSGQFVGRCILLANHPGMSLAERINPDPYCPACCPMFHRKRIETDLCVS